MVVEHRQRPHRLWPAAGPLEVHLPEFVGSTALEALRGRAAAVLVAHQIVTQQDAVDGAASQRKAVAIEQDLKLARTPVGIPLPHLDNLLFALEGGLRGTAAGSAAVLGKAFHPAGAIAFQPSVSRRTGDAELRAQSPQRLLPPRRRHHKTHSLLVNVHRLPCHPFTLPRSLRSPRECKPCVETTCKGCHETEQPFAMGGI